MYLPLVLATAWVLAGCTLTYSCPLVMHLCTCAMHPSLLSWSLHYCTVIYKMAVMAFLIFTRFALVKYSRHVYIHHKVRIISLALQLTTTSFDWLLAFIKTAYTFITILKLVISFFIKWHHDTLFQYKMYCGLQ